MNMLFRITAVVGVALAVASPVEACPFCDSSTAEEVRAGIFNFDFGYHLAVTFAPFPILVAALILLYYWPSLRGFQRTPDHTSSLTICLPPTPSEQS